MKDDWPTFQRESPSFFGEEKGVRSRLPEVGTSIFSVMSKLALEHNAINLSQGFPDFPVSEVLVDLIHKNMRAGHNQYAPMPGVPALRKVIAEVIEKTYQRATDFETEVTVTAGGTEAIFATIAAMVTAGDEVILFDPSYDCYDPAIRLNGGTPIHINLTTPDFSIDWQEVRDKVTSKTRMIMVNTPHNPSGAVLSEQDARELQEIALKNNLLVLSDEVYERIIFDDKKHESILKYPALANQSIAVFSFGKTFHATGWKVGYAVASAALASEIRKAHQFITFSVNTPTQFALAEYMAQPENYLNLGKFYQQKRDFFLQQIKGSSFMPLPCYGSYFQLLSYEGISELSEREMAVWMTKEKKLAPIPISVFYKDGIDQKILRFCFAKGEETLRKAGEILKQM
ncbi:MAG: methionine aminotransferase [Cytophagales bacterium]